MQRSALVLGLAAVFAGLTVLTTMLALGFKQYLLFLLAAPFGVTAYLMWYHATGRLKERARTRAATAADGAGRRQDAARGPRQSRSRFGEGARRAAEQARREARRDGRRGPGPGRQRRRRTGPRGRFDQQPDDGPSLREASNVLGVDPDADADAVRRAYREQVKEVHPDTESGDEEAFKRVNAAYERLRERP